MSEEGGNHFVGEEFAGCDFRDKRLTQRAQHIAERTFSRPGSTIWSTFRTNAERKAAYQFFNNPKVGVNTIQHPHFEKTRAKVAQTPENVLWIQDTTYCYLKDGKAFEITENYLGKTSKSKNLQGVALHSVLALTPQGVPLGLVHQEIYQHHEKKEHHKDLPIEKKESYRWLEALKLSQETLPEKQNVIHIGDREADIFEVLSYGAQSNTKFIIRKARDRVTGENYRQSEGLISDRLEAVAACYAYEAEIYDQASSSYVRRKLRVKAVRLTFPVPKGKVFEQEVDLNQSFEMNVVEACSVDALPEIRWVLLTNLPIEDEASVLQVIEFYKLRWHIESYHKVLKSGFKIEETRLETLEGIEKLLSLLSILAVKLYYLIHLSRLDGAQPCDGVLEKHEWQALCIQHGKTSFQGRETAEPPTVKEALTMIAQLGGYMNRKKDPPPGIIVVWRGWQRFSEIAAYHKVITNTNQTYG